MKHKLFFSIISLSILFIFCGCKKEKDPEGKADFTYELLPNGGIKVNYTGTGSPVSWNFGGPIRVKTNNSFSFSETGEVTASADETEVIGYYEKNGNYTITLKSQLNSSSSTDEKSYSAQISTAPNAFKLKRVSLHFMYFGNQWDGGVSGPDITFAYLTYNNNSQPNYISSKYNDIDNSMLPINYFLSSPQTFTYAENGWDTTYDSRFIAYAVEDTDETAVTYGYIYHPMKNTTDENPYPTIFKDYTDDNLSFEIEVEWISQ